MKTDGTFNAAIPRTPFLRDQVHVRAVRDCSPLHTYYAVQRELPFVGTPWIGFYKCLNVAAGSSRLFVLGWGVGGGEKEGRFVERKS